MMLASLYFQGKSKSKGKLGFNILSGKKSKGMESGIIN